MSAKSSDGKLSPILEVTSCSRIDKKSKASRRELVNMGSEISETSWVDLFTIAEYFMSYQSKAETHQLSLL